jgi:hypothetical protein
MYKYHVDSLSPRGPAPVEAEVTGYGREATGLVVPDDLAVEERLPPRALSQDEASVCRLRLSQFCHQSLTCLSLFSCTLYGS